MKKCGNCGETKSVSEYHRDKYQKDGLRSKCKACVKDDNDRFRREHPDYSSDYYERNRDRVNARASAWQRSHPESVKEARRRYAEAHKDEVSEWGRQFRATHPTYDSEWRADNRERVNERSRRRYWSDPDRARAIGRADAALRRARLAGAQCERVDPLEVWERDAGICGICHKACSQSNWNLDHIVPISRGGAHAYANTRISHPRCNSWKHARLDEELPPVPAHILTAGVDAVPA